MNPVVKRRLLYLKWQKMQASFIKALGLEKVDILGFSIGGFVAQELALQQPNLVRRIVLSGTGPQSGVNDPRKDVYEAMTKVYGDANDALENFLFLFYGPTETSRTAGISSIKRILTQKKVESSLQVCDAQLQAISQWAKQEVKINTTGCKRLHNRYS